MLGLPDHLRACLFDLDGVLTPTADVHRAAWAETFNEYLRQRAERTGEPFVPFDPGADYHTYVDGKARADGVRSFLAARGITLPEGAPDDLPEAETVNGLGNRKNTLLQARLRERGVTPFPGSVAYLRAAERAGLRRAVVSASANCREVVAAAGLTDLLEVRVDGLTARQEGLRGKPHPDTFLAAAQRLGVKPDEAAVFEDALAGVAAGRAGGFGLVVGVDRVGQADALRRHGADIVVRDLADLLPDAAASQPPAAGPAASAEAAGPTPLEPR
jgi:beta-phosphoglucomutase family hydrolase